MTLPPRNENAAPALLRRWLATGLTVTAVSALAALLHSRFAALGVFLGGMAGTTAFGMMARQMNGLRGPNPQVALRRIYASVVVRLALYGAALLAALALDPERLRAFAGAAAGIILVRTAVVVVGAAEARRLVKRLSAESGNRPDGS